MRREREAAESRRRQEKQRRAALEAQRQAHLRQEAERLRLAAVSNGYGEIFAASSDSIANNKF